MKAFHSNILKLMDNIINKIAANIHDFSVSDHDFVRCHKLNAVDLIKLILNQPTSKSYNKYISNC